MTRSRKFVGRLSRWSVFFALVLAVAAPSTSAFADTTFPSDVLGSGSDVTWHVSDGLDLLYNESPGCTTIAPSGTQPLDLGCIPQAGDVTTENYAHDRISQAASIGGGAGVTQLCQQTLPGVADIDYARQTSGPGAGVCTGLHYVAFARDGVTWEAFPGLAGSATASMNNQSGACAGSSGYCLTQAQLKNIFVNCTITNWNQVGGASHAIVIYTIKPQFGTRKAWDTFLGGSSSSCPGVKLVDQTDNSEISKADKKYAIVPVSAGSWRERYSKKTGGSRLGSIDGVAPTLPNEQDGSFPYSRFLYNVFCAASSCGTASQATAATSRYVAEDGWICTSDAHAKDPITSVDYRTEIANTITTYGFAPLPLGPTGGGTALVNYCRLFTT
jgi:hypothetical protein